MNQATTLAPEQTRPGLEFATLSRTIRSAGLLDRRYAYYAVTWVLTIAAFGGAWVAFALIGDTWWQLLVAAGLAVISTHLSFVGHDAGHRQIFRGRPANDAVGYLHGGLVGMSFGGWVEQHNAHHRNPNHETDDPDLDLPVIAFTDSQSRAKKGFQRWTTKHQAFLFFPLLLLEGLNLHWAAMRSAWQGKLERPRLERTLMLVHIGAYLGAVFIVLPVPLGLAFIGVHQGLWGLYMGCSFAPNHKGMPTLTDADELDFLRKQVLTSRNAGRGRWTSFALGGLNYQIEHHLFPSMPRCNLRRAQPLVKDFCVERGISYSETGLVASYRLVLSHLHAVGAPLRRASRRQPAGAG